MESRRAGQMNAVHGGQGVEELCFELPTLISGDGLRASEANYPSGQQGSGSRLCCHIWQENGFRPALNRSTALRQFLKPSDVGSGPTMST